MVNPHDLAVATIEHLDKLPRTPERSKHKFNMIRIAEKAYRSLNPVDDQPFCEAVDVQTAMDQIQEAAGFAQANAA